MIFPAITVKTRYDKIQIKTVIFPGENKIESCIVYFYFKWKYTFYELSTPDSDETNSVFYHVMCLDPSGSSSMLMDTVSAGRSSFTVSGHSMKHRAPLWKQSSAPVFWASFVFFTR